MRETGRRREGQILLCAAVALGLAIQVQLTVPLGAGAMRLNLADPLAGLIALWALIARFRDHRSLVRAATLPVAASLGAATLALALSFAIGIRSAGEVMPWAAVKFVGWFALLAYFLCGLALARERAPRDGFVLAFALALAALALVQLVSLVLHLDLFGAGQTARFYALAVNPNALALMFLAGFILAVAVRPAAAGKRMGLLLGAAAALNLAGIVLTGSVAAFLVVPPVIVALALLRVSWRRLAVVAAAALVLVTPARLSQDADIWSFAGVESKIGGLVSGDEQDAHLKKITVGVRLEGLRRGLAEWRANPLFGAGLGMHLANQRQSLENPDEALQIHNTPVWLLAETGLFGLLSVAALFIAIFWAILWRLLAHARAGPGAPPRHASLPAAIAVFLGAAILMSLAHEFLYQRVIWVLIALPLAAEASGLERRMHAESAPAKADCDA